MRCGQPHTVTAESTKSKEYNQMRTLKTIIAAGLFTALTASAAIAQDQAASFNAQNANVHSGTGGQPLTLPSQASAPSVVTDFLRGEGLSGDTVGSLCCKARIRPRAPALPICALDNRSTV